MKIRGAILSTLAMIVLFTACAMGSETEPATVSSAKPVMVPYLNKSISEVKNGYAGTSNASVDASSQGTAGTAEAVGEDSDKSDEGLHATIKNAGAMEERETAVSELVEQEESGTGADPVLTYLGTYTATAYCACPICTGEYSTGYTASGTFATEGRTVACNSLPFGTQIYIEGYGYYTVEDTGWSPYGDAWLDIFYFSHDSALAFGVRNVEVYLVN